VGFLGDEQVGAIRWKKVSKPALTGLMRIFGNKLLEFKDSKQDR